MASLGFVGVTGRFCSNIFARDVEGGVGESLVRLRSCLEADALPAVERDSKLSRRLGGCAVGLLVSSLAKTLPTLPDGGRTSRSFACRSFMGEVSGVA
jgi:hypothetical protein